VRINIGPLNRTIAGADLGKCFGEGCGKEVGGNSPPSGGLPEKFLPLSY